MKVDWDVNFENNDPDTSPRDRTGTVYFYENVTVPILRGASAVSAVSPSGTQLDVTLQDEGRGPTIAATISFDERVFLGESYDFHLAYELSDVRVPSLLVTPTYVYLPVIAGGDEAIVTVSYPTGDGWSVSLEAADCVQDGSTFSCNGDDSGFLAALLEVSRPDALARMPFEVPLQNETVSVDFSYFAGEEAEAKRLTDLATAALPIIEQQYGFAYPGAGSIRLSQGGRQEVLGYEGLTSCDAADCQVVVSPAADDLTFIHELAHLWSEIYGKRWLSEGFAQLIAEDTAAALPEGMVLRLPLEREPASIDLRLNDWGEVSSLIGAEEAERQTENAGYDLSLRFLRQLQAEAGSDALSRTNAAIAAGGYPADSRRFLDVLEETSDKVFDGLFAERVFAPSFKPKLDARRQARDRLKDLTRRTAEAGLSDDVPILIREALNKWQFEAASMSLDVAERQLLEYEVLKSSLSVLTDEAQSAGLKLPTTIADEIGKWEFASARLMFADASQAVDAYVQAKDRTRDPRNLWERFGLIGRDPDKDLSRAEDAFVAGDFKAALDHANNARDTVNGAADTALRRLLVLGLVFSMIALGIGGAVWYSQRREREFSGF